MFHGRYFSFYRIRTATDRGDTDRDYVWSENTETGEKELKKVLSVSVTETDVLVHVTTENGTVINTTENHPFYVEGKGWCAAAQLEPGDVLRTQDGETEIVEGVQIENLDEAVKVYNLEIEGSHTYYVSADEVLVHNECNVTGGKNLKEHYVKHKDLLTEITGKKYPKYKESNECEEFLKDIGNLIEINEVEFIGTGTLKKGAETMNIYRGRGITIVLKLNNEFVTILKSGEGLDLGIMFD